MKAETVVTSLLNASSAVAAIVGSGAAARIYGGRAPQEVVKPFVVYRKLQGERAAHVASAQSNAVAASIELVVCAVDYPTLKSLAEAARVALAYQYGAIAGVQVVSITVASEGPDEYDEELGLFGQNWVYLVTHME